MRTRRDIPWLVVAVAVALAILAFVALVILVFNVAGWVLAYPGCADCETLRDVLLDALLYIGKIDLGTFATIANLMVLVTSFALALSVTNGSPGRRRVEKWIINSAHQRRVRPRAGRELRRAITSALLDSLESDQFDRAGRVLAEARAIQNAGTQISQEELSAIIRWMRRVALAARNSLVGRTLTPDSMLALAAVAIRLAETAESLVGLKPFNPALLSRSRFNEFAQGTYFRDFASAMSGAVVLVDAVESRSGYASTISHSHSRTYSPSIDHGARFDTVHRDDPGCEHQTAMLSSADARLGDYDGRVLNLTEARLRRNSASADITFLLTTTESCYAATEISAERCKHLDSNDVADSGKWTLDYDGSKFVSATAGTNPGRLALLTAFTSLVIDAPVSAEETTSGPTRERFLVLTRTSTNKRNGSGVVSLAGGGVINLPSSGLRGDDGDEDEYGQPDPRAAAIRELHEELGIHVPPEGISPVAVYLTNERGNQSAVDGQLVATVAFSARLRMSKEAFHAMRSAASAAHGTYEVDGHIFVPIATPPDPSSSYDDFNSQRETKAREFATELWKWHDTIDQRAILAALYLGVAEFGVAACVSAFSGVWRKPWYMFGWKFESNPDASRTRQCAAFTLLADSDTVARIAVLTRQYLAG